MISQPLVSIVIPTRNRKELLRRAVKSLSEQSYQKLQIIVHDNNTSNLSEIDINPGKDPRIEFYKSNKDLGMLENWQKGLSYVKGDLFIRFDDDNILCKTYIHDVVNYFTKYKVRMVTSNCLITQNNRSINSLIPINQQCRILSKKQFLYFTFHNIIDSNYSVYDFKFLLDHFDLDKIYETNLPDRYLDLRLANMFNVQDVLFVESVAGISRMDYRVPEFNINMGELSFNDIMGFRNGLMTSQISPHHNFTLSRFFVFLKYYQEGYVTANHFFNKIISYPFLEMELLLGNLSKSREGFYEKFRYYLKLVLILISNPRSYFRCKSGLSVLPMATKVFLKALFQSRAPNVFEKKPLHDLSFWSDRLESFTCEEFIRTYSCESVPKIRHVYFDTDLL